MAQAEAALRETDQAPGTANALPRMVEHYLRELRRLVGKDPDRARVILQKLIGEVTLEPNDQGLMAVLRGNVCGNANLEDGSCTTGAGSPVPMLPSTVIDRRIVA